jgi:hypothetical protein
LTAALGIVVLLLPWLIHASQTARRIGTTDQLRLFDYRTAVLRTSPGDPNSPPVSTAGWIERVRSNAGDLGRTLADGVLGSPRMVVALALLALLCLGFAEAVRAGPSLLDWLAAAAGVLLLAYFSFAERLLLPLLPAAYSYLLLAARAGASSVSTRLGAPRLAGAGLGVVATALVGLNLAKMPSPSSLRAADSRVAQRGDPGVHMGAQRTAAAWLREHTRPATVVLTTPAPEISVLSGRRAYTLLFLPKTAAALDGAVRRYEANYLIFLGSRGEADAEHEARAAEIAIRTWRLPGGPSLDGVRIYEVDR